MPLIFTRRKIVNGKFSKKHADKPGYYSFERPVANPRRWDAKSLTQSRWLSAIKADASTKDVLIHVHGFNSSQAGTLSRHRAIEGGLRAQGYKGAVVSYDWPNRAKGTPGAYEYDLTKNAPAISRYLVEDAILPLLNMSWKPRVHLFAHSMGAFVVAHGFMQFGNSFGPGTGPWKVNHIIQASGDAHRDWYETGAGASMSLEVHSRRLTNFNTRDDGVLTLSVAWNRFQKRVGLNGLPAQTSREHFNVDGTRNYRDTKPDFGGDNGKELLYSHRWWFESDWFFKRAARTLEIGR
jgi:esterase/lipase superfamily enzyme